MKEIDKNKIIIILFSILFLMMEILGLYLQYNENIIISILGVLMAIFGLILLICSAMIYNVLSE